MNVAAPPETHAATFADALKGLGASPRVLTADEKHALDTDGYCVIPRLIDGERLAVVRDAFERLLAAKLQHAKTTQPAASSLDNLIDQGELFEPFFLHPKVLSVVQYVLQEPFRLALFAGISVPSGTGLQSLHVHSGGPDGVPNERPFTIQALWMLDDFTQANGGTRVVPGSHRWAYPDKLVKDLREPHPQEIVVCAPAGSVLLHNGRLWHARRVNTTDTTRRSIVSYYQARSAEYPTRRNDVHLFPGVRVQHATLQRLKPDVLALLGTLGFLCSVG